MPLKIIQNRKGMSLIEVLVAAGLMAIVAMGMGGVITSMNKEQNNQVRLATLRELKTRIQSLITDQNSWNKTMQMNNGATNPMKCLLDHSACTPGTYDLLLYDPAGNAFINPPPPYAAVPPAGSQGFTDKGAVCSNFNGNANAGVDSCPISYKIVWEPVCPVTGACINPLVRVNARLLFNPSDSAQIPSVSLASGSMVNNDSSLGKYDVVIKRSATTINKAFSYAIKVINATGLQHQGQGGGDCAATGSYTIRGKKVATMLQSTTGGQYPPWVVESDPFSLVNLDITTGEMRLEPGTYNCKVTAAAWAVNSFSIRLYNVSDGVQLNDSVATSNANTASYSQSIATSNPIISISAQKKFRLEQSCSFPTYVDAVGRKYNMGLASEPYSSPSTVATFSCTQTN